MRWVRSLDDETDMWELSPELYFMVYKEDKG